MRAGLLFFAVALATLGPGATLRAEERLLDEARQPIEGLYAALLESMKGGEDLTPAERSAIIAAAADRAYDFDFMASRALGRHWRGLSEAQRAEWSETFRGLTVHTYASRFDTYSGQRFDVGEVTPASRGTAVVRTHLRSPGEEPVEIRYRMRARGTGGDDPEWRIVDIYLNGTISELALRRSEYATVIERDGFDHLVRSLREKSETPAAATPAD